MATQQEIDQFNYILTRVEVERQAAIGHLFTILDGDNRSGAINDARAWLLAIYGEDYPLTCRLSLAASKALQRAHKQRMSL